MNFLSINLLIILIEILKGQDNSCKVKLTDSCFIAGTYYGSDYGQSKKFLFYHSFVGEVYRWYNYTGDIQTSKSVMNETIITRDGFTGQEINNGWFWMYTEGNIFYVKYKLGGVEQPCQGGLEFPFQRMSIIYKNLKNLSPTLGKPDDKFVCQGLVDDKISPSNGEIVNIVYEYGDGDSDRLLFVSNIAETRQTEDKIEVIRPLESGDEVKFVNVCEKSGVVVEEISQETFVELRNNFHMKSSE